MNNIQNTLSTKQSNLTIVGQGKQGEEYIKELIQNKYIDGIIEDTSGQTARGDLFFKWKNIKCLIEIKNKLILTKEDIDKFIRDVAESKQSNCFINCALFISLRTNTFPKRTKETIQLDYINGIPVFYLFLEHELLLYNTILLLHNLITIQESISIETVEFTNLKKHFIDYYNISNEDHKRLEKLIKEKKKELIMLCNMRDDIEKRLSLMQQDYSKYINTNTNDDSIYDEIIYEPDVSINNTEIKQSDTSSIPITAPNIKTYYIRQAERGYVLTQEQICKELHISPQILSTFGGYQKIVSDAQQEYMYTIINRETYNKIMELKIQNSAFPKRADLVKNKIMTDTDIRKIGYVLNVRNTMKSIEQFCSSATYV